MSCKQCGNCCQWGGHVHLINADIKKISKFLGVSEREFINKYTCLTSNRQGLSLIEHEDGRCIFLSDKSCQVYQVRPAQCRDFPYTWTVKDMENCRFYEK